MTTNFEEVTGDLWSLNPPPNYRVIPVNREGVYGAGLARQAVARYPGLTKAHRNWRARIRVGNIPVYGDSLAIYHDLILFPTKDKPSDMTASLHLIEANLSALSICLTWEEVWTRPEFKGARIAMPRIGCGLGKLDWDWDVKPLIYQHLQGLSQTFVLVSPPQE